MIPEYKLFHGAAFAEIIDSVPGAVTIRELVDEGRMSSYILNEKVGIHLKHSAQPLHPWQFTFSAAHIRSLRDLIVTYPLSYLVLVCKTDGMTAIPIEEAIRVLGPHEASGSWLRVDRKKRQMYRVFGPEGEFPGRYRTDLKDVVQAISL